MTLFCVFSNIDIKMDATLGFLKSHAWMNLEVLFLSFFEIEVQ